MKEEVKYTEVYIPESPSEGLRSLFEVYPARVVAKTPRELVDPSQSLYEERGKMTEREPIIYGEFYSDARIEKIEVEEPVLQATGVLDMHGRMIYYAPNKIGFDLRRRNVNS